MGTAANVQTTIVNNQNATIALGCVPPHGVRLGPFQQYTFPGHVDRLWTDTNGKFNKRKADSVQAALAAGTLLVITTPPPVYLDTQTGAAKVESYTNGTESVVNPSWGAYTALHGSFSAPTTGTTTTVASATFTFSGPVTGFNSFSQITLTAGGIPATLTTANNPTTSDNTTFTIPGLTSLTGGAGVAYVLSVPATTTIVDQYGNPLLTTSSVAWTHS